MNGYMLTAVIVVTVGAVAIVFAVCLRRTSETALKEARQTVTEPCDAAAGVANNAIEAARSTAAPVAHGVADICHAIARRIETKRDELKALREQVATLTYENEQLKSRRISVDQIQPILKIAFLQADFSETNFVRKIIRETPGSGTGRDEKLEYLGVYRATNTQRLGVDLNRMKFRLVAQATIEVGGFDTTEVIGNLNTQIKPLHTELRRHLTGGFLSDSHEIVTGDIDNLLLAQDRAQREELHNTITQNRAVEQIDRTLEQMALQFLKDYFHPRGYTVTKAVGDLSEGKSLFQISAELNSQIDDERSKKARLLTDAITGRDELERQLALDIEELKAVGTGTLNAHQRAGARVPVAPSGPSQLA